MNTRNYLILMKESNEKERKEFLLKFYNSSSILSFKNALSEILNHSVQCLFFTPEGIPIEKKIDNRHIVDCLKKIKTKSIEKIQVFDCSCKRHCLFIPIKQGDNIYGYIFLLHLDYTADRKDIFFIKSFVHIALREFQKEQELTRLYDTIRPRAIALSTIHTIHRLLSSTLDMDELIERITRLTLQVMRARCCSIMLIDSSKNYLIPQAVIDLEKHGQRLHKKCRKIKLGVTAEGKVAKTGKTNFTRNSICVPLIEEDIIGIISTKNKTNNSPFNKFDLEILLTFAEQAVIAIRNAQLYEEQEKMAYGSIKSLVALLDAKSPNTYTHTEQFVKIILLLAEEMKLSRDEIRDLHYAALLPDTGKFSIPDEILRKKGGLSREEYDIIKKRHLESLKILEPLEFLKPSMPIIIYHHERYDGTGYPEGLKGKQIPLGARIMAVADAFEAMVSSRPYKDSRVSISQALNEIKKNKGFQFDPEVVDAFITVSKRPEFKKIMITQ